MTKESISVLARAFRLFVGDWLMVLQGASMGPVKLPRRREMVAIVLIAI